MEMNTNFVIFRAWGAKFLSPKFFTKILASPLTSRATSGTGSGRKHSGKNFPAFQHDSPPPKAEFLPHPWTIGCYAPDKPCNVWLWASRATFENFADVTSYKCCCNTIVADSCKKSIDIALSHVIELGEGDSWLRLRFMSSLHVSPSPTPGAL